MSLEGELRVRLSLHDGRIARVDLQSTRPDVAATLLQQRTPQELTAAVPRLFAICGVSQSVACRLALAAAAGSPSDTEALALCSAEVAAEIVRESSRRALLDAPRQIGETPSQAAVQAARIAMQWPAPEAEASSALALALFGMAADDWLALDTPTALAGWISVGRTATARELQALVDGDAGSQTAALLPATPSDHIGEWLPEPGVDAGFARQPVWRGRPAETGALARLQADPWWRRCCAMTGAACARAAWRGCANWRNCCAERNRCSPACSTRLPASASAGRTIRVVCWCTSCGWPRAVPSPTASSRPPNGTSTRTAPCRWRCKAPL